MKKVWLLSFWMLLISGLATVAFNSCSSKKMLYHDEGVVINGVKWATRNVDSPRKFAAKPEDAGMFYQWNRKKAWAATGKVKRWDESTPIGTTWEKSIDPSPTGWRLPTKEEFDKLRDKNKVSSEWTTVNGVAGRKFTDKTSGNSIFLPAVGFRDYSDGTLYNAGSFGNYWSSTQSNAAYAYGLDFGSGNAYVYGYGDRANGLSCRCVAE
jgi:uncharacterized protein (TIGR02145 family)